MRPNRLKERWREDEATFGVWLSACSAFLTEHLAAVGFDWLLVDGEHSAVDLQTMVQMFQAISTAESVPLARVSWNDPVQIKRVLDSGAYGVVIPWVNNEEEVKRRWLHLLMPKMTDEAVEAIAEEDFGNVDREVVTRELAIRQALLRD